ncbi:MAG TPA: SpoIID/LytB domain-containing protein, partial [Gaiellaceae bacterium]|nr:SpoIID/LytB domain-containing protein [Gaiellaceae bacterium]
MGVTLGLAAVVSATTGSARGGTALVVTGHGWGHGVGMSQWGAYGYARHGWKYRRILSHYYPGTKMGHVGELRVRVLLAHGSPAVKVGCATAMRVTDGRRLTRTLRAGTYSVGPRLVLPARRRGKSLSFGHFVLFECDRAPLTFDGREYHGTLALRSSGRGVSVVNGLALDTYLRGVVPSESPSRWPLAELEAQAVAARSYAVAELRPDSWYDLLPTTRDQVYGGVRAETPHTDHAVYATLGQVLMWDGEVARTYYSSSSGGRTEAVQDAWPGSSPIPYLRSVPDPYDTYSPHHDWGPFGFSGSRLGARLGLGSAVESVRVERDQSLRAESVNFRLASGAVVSRSAVGVARALHLLSTWFSFGQLQLSTSSTRVLYGRYVTVAARAVDVKGTLLQQRTLDGAWRTVQHVRRPEQLRLRPQASTAFRLVAPGTTATSVSVAVAPRLRVQALSPRLLVGEVSPRPDASVAVWRIVRGRWRVVAHPILDSRGEFRTPLPL